MCQDAKDSHDSETLYVDQTADAMGKMYEHIRAKVISPDGETYLFDGKENKKRLNPISNIEKVNVSDQTY